MKNFSNIRHIILTVFFLMPAIVSNSQTFEEFVKQRENDFRQFKKQHEQFIRQMSQRYDDYVKQRDKEFTEYLNQRWHEYQLFAGLKLEEKPKPVIIPEHDPTVIISRPISLPFKYPDAEPPVPSGTEPKLPVMQKTEPERFSTRSTGYDFYGNQVSLT